MNYTHKAMEPAQTLNESNAQSLIQALQQAGVDTSPITTALAVQGAAGDNSVATAVANALHQFLFAQPTATKGREGREKSVSELLDGAMSAIRSRSRY